MLYIKYFLYYIWMLVYKIIVVFDNIIGKICTFYNPHLVTSEYTYIRDLGSVYQYILLLFYARRSFWFFSNKLTDMTRLYKIRLTSYPLINLFFSKKIKKKTNIIYMNEYILREISIYSKSNNFFKSTVDKIIIYTIFNKYLHKLQYINNFSKIFPSEYDVLLPQSVDSSHAVKTIFKVMAFKRRFVSVSVNKFNWVYGMHIVMGNPIFWRKSPKVEVLTDYDIRIDSLKISLDKPQEGPFTYSYIDREKLITKYHLFYNKTLNLSKFTLLKKTSLILFYQNITSKYVDFKKNNYKMFSWPVAIKFKPTDVTSYFSFSKSESYITFFIRKNKIFNKGRYSRNRQLYRTGVYWCIWLNIICVFGLYYYFYRFVFNFGFIYLPLLVMILSVFGSRIVKYRLYNYKNILIELTIFERIVMSFVREYVIGVIIYLKDLSVRLVLYLIFCTKRIIKYFM